jgi:hypothetical protein
VKSSRPIAQQRLREQTLHERRHSQVGRGTGEELALDRVVASDVDRGHERVADRR